MTKILTWLMRVSLPTPTILRLSRKRGRRGAGVERLLKKFYGSGNADLVGYFVPFKDMASPITTKSYSRWRK